MNPSVSSLKAISRPAPLMRAFTRTSTPSTSPLRGLRGTARKDCER